MADIPGLPNIIQLEETDFNSPASEQTMQRIGGSINFLLQNSGRVALYEFLVDSVWTVPDGVTGVYLIGCSGGQGGSISIGGAGTGPSGAGTTKSEVFLPVQPGETVNITIGEGGFGNIFAGGQLPQPTIFSPSVTTSSLVTFKYVAFDNSNNVLYNRGATINSTIFDQQGGNPGPFGDGADYFGQSGITNTPGTDAAPNTGAGGSSASSAPGGSEQQGGAGGSGRLYVIPVVFQV